VIHVDENEFSFYSSLKEIEEDGYTPIKVWSLLQFYTLRGKTPVEILNKIKIEAAEMFEQNEDKKLSKNGAISLIRKRYNLPIDENTNIMRKDNLCPIPGLSYCVLTFWGEEDRYYVKNFRGYSVDELYFYRRTLDFSGEDTAIESLRRYVSDERVWLLYDPAMVEETKDTLDKIFKANINGNGKLTYRIYITMLDYVLKLEDDKDYGKNLPGFRTACKIIEDQITNLWKEASRVNN